VARAGLWIPVITLVPVIHLIFGVFPVTFNIWVVVFMMAHYTLRTVMLHFCDSLKQMRALWLARVAVAIFWWSDLKAATLVPAKGVLSATPGDVSFRSRSWSTAVPVRNLKALVLPVGFVATSLVAFVGGCLMLRSVINLPTVLSLCLVVINFAPPALLCLYWAFGPGRLLSQACTLFMLLSWAAGAIAMVFLWLLWPRDVDFKAAAEMSLSFFDAQRSGALPSNYPITWRGDSGLQNVALMTFANDTGSASSTTSETISVDLTGGFYNDGEAGPVKITWNIAITTTMLAWSMLEYQDFWEADVVRVNHALALLTHGLTYVKAAYQVTPLRDATGQQQSANYDQIVYVVRARPVLCVLRARRVQSILLHHASAWAVLLLILAGTRPLCPAELCSSSLQTAPRAKLPMAG
jgi:Glycosyl hydrolase family 9